MDDHSRITVPSARFGQVKKRTPSRDLDSSSGSSFGVSEASSWRTSRGADDFQRADPSLPFR